MPRRPSPTRRWLTAMTWPVGIALTSWDYMWRSTPMRRRETVISAQEPSCAAPELTSEVDRAEVQGADAGWGPLFHRRYGTRVRGAQIGAQELIGALQANLNHAAPTTFARFQKVLGATEQMRVGDEYVVRMPGPWDGPVRVVSVQAHSFRFATLRGHLEAGQIEFRAADGDEPGQLIVEIESWARSSGRWANLLYHRLRMAKEVQAHMWISFLEGAARLAGGDMVGGVSITTERADVR